MKKLLTLTTLLITISILSSCSKTVEDLTIDILGEYTGILSHNEHGIIETFVINVTKIDENTIKVTPVSGNQITEFETKLYKLNPTNLSSTNPKDSNNLDKLTLFVKGVISTDISISKNQNGGSIQDAYAYTGMLKI